MAFTETDETNIRHLHSLLFAFSANKAFLINFFNCAMKAGMQAFLSFKCIVNKGRPN